MGESISPVRIRERGAGTISTAECRPPPNAPGEIPAAPPPYCRGSQESPLPKLGGVDTGVCWSNKDTWESPLPQCGGTHGRAYWSE